MRSDSELPSIRVRDLSVTYRTLVERKPTLRSAVLKLGRGDRYQREIEAVKHVSFDVPRGTVVGIIGNNGAGKSTLVRAVAGILPPTAGRIEIHGRISTLLALGVGFNKDLSGHENVVLGGLAAGYTRAEIESRYEEIAEWTELGEFLELPMRAYSSGMYSRLAFALAVHMDPDILVVDEALSTGDAGFKAKATEKMLELVEQAGTMLLVSHALGTVREMCTEAIWMHDGELKFMGKPQDVINVYTEFNNVEQNATTLEDV